MTTRAEILTTFKAEAVTLIHQIEGFTNDCTAYAAAGEWADAFIAIAQAVETHTHLIESFIIPLFDDLLLTETDEILGECLLSCNKVVDKVLTDNGGD